MADPFNLERFVAAQDPIYHRVIAELRRGMKQTHWMWFVFPQIAGLGRSTMAERYAISSLEEVSLIACSARACWNAHKPFWMSLAAARTISSARRTISNSTRP